MMSRLGEWLFLKFLALSARLSPSARDTLAAALYQLGRIWNPLGRVVNINLRLCDSWLKALLPDYDPEDFSQQTQRFYMINVLEYGIALHQPLERQRAFYDPESLEEFEQRARELLDRGKGLIVLCCHLGNTEHLSYPITRVSSEPIALYSKARKPQLDAAIFDLRRRWGLSMCAADTAGVRRIFTGLKNGELIAMLADQRPGRTKHSAHSPFMGSDALSPGFLPNLVRRTGAPVLALAVIRSGAEQLQTITETVSEDIASEDINTAVRAQNEAIENLIRHAPTQYFWHYKRFSRRAEAPHNPYR